MLFSVDKLQPDMEDNPDKSSDEEDDDKEAKSMLQKYQIPWSSDNYHFN